MAVGGASAWGQHVEWSSIAGSRKSSSESLTALEKKMKLGGKKKKDRKKGCHVGPTNDMGVHINVVKPDIHPLLSLFPTKQKNRDGSILSTKHNVG